MTARCNAESDIEGGIVVAWRQTEWGQAWFEALRCGTIDHRGVDRNGSVIDVDDGHQAEHSGHVFAFCHHAGRHRAATWQQLRMPATGAVEPRARNRIGDRDPPRNSDAQMTGPA